MNRTKNTPQECQPTQSNDSADLPIITPGPCLTDDALAQRLCEIYYRHIARAKTQGDDDGLNSLLSFRDAVLDRDFPRAFALVQHVVDCIARAMPARMDGSIPTIPAEISSFYGEPETAGKPLTDFLTPSAVDSYRRQSDKNKARHNRKTEQGGPTPDDIRKAYSESEGETKAARVQFVMDLLGVSKSTVNRAVPTSGRRGRPKKNSSDPR